MKFLRLTAVAAIAGAAGCSGGTPVDSDTPSTDGTDAVTTDTGTVGDTGTSSGTDFGCDVTMNGTRRCTDYVGYPAGASTPFCPAPGMVLASCPHAGATGGCLVHQPGAATSVTVWDYTRTAAEAMTSCASTGGMFVTP